MQIWQQTIARAATLSGIGLHRGEPVTVTLRPAEAGTGILFHCQQAEEVVTIPALLDFVVDTRLATVLGHQGATVSTVEHLMAALAAFGVDNLHIDIDGPEVPILDGSAAPWCELLLGAGLQVQERPRRYLVLDTPLSVTDGARRLTLTPAKQLRITGDITFAHPEVGAQSRSVTITRESFVSELAAARTFGFLRDVEQLKAMGLARGGSLANAVVLGEQRILNPEGLRYPDEFVRHKIMDALGDFYLLGAPLLAHVVATRSGHDLNHRMTCHLRAAEGCWHLSEARPPAASRVRQPRHSVLCPVA